MQIFYCYSKVLKFQNFKIKPSCQHHKMSKFLRAFQFFADDARAC